MRVIIRVRHVLNINFFSPKRIPFIISYRTHVRNYTTGSPPSPPQCTPSHTRRPGLCVRRERDLLLLLRNNISPTLEPSSVLRSAVERYWSEYHQTIFRLTKTNRKSLSRRLTKQQLIGSIHPIPDQSD